MDMIPEEFVIHEYSEPQALWNREEASSERLEKELAGLTEKLSHYRYRAAGVRLSRLRELFPAAGAELSEELAFLFGETAGEEEQSRQWERRGREMEWKTDLWRCLSGYSSQRIRADRPEQEREEENGPETEREQEAAADSLSEEHAQIRGDRLERASFFRFADAQEDTLSHLNFVCRRGETTAIIGGTGSGKSTVASLILRFHDVTQGSVCLNGMDIRKMTQHDLRDHMAYVQQKAWLFSGTIADNLRYSNKNASDEELMHAADVAQAGDFIRSLSKGLDSYVAQGGTNFSGGQKQRLSIARALVKKLELYIFDDSFSALDFKTDAALRRALKDETGNAAVLIIAQRVSTIQHASQIVVLNEGKMDGIGTHDELLKNCAVYREIYESQTKEAQEA